MIILLIIVSIPSFQGLKPSLRELPIEARFLKSHEIIPKPKHTFKKVFFFLLL